MLNAKEFYRDTDVIRRVLEYCGVRPQDSEKFHYEHDLDKLTNSKNLRDLASLSTVEYVSGWGEHFLHTKGKKQSSDKVPRYLGMLLDEGLDIFRSLWDKKKVTFLLDVEYISKVSPREVYINPVGTFNKLEPAYWCIWDIFKEYGIKPMTLVTGQGYHFVFDVESYESSQNSKDLQVTKTAKRLTELGHLEWTTQAKYENLNPSIKRDRIVDVNLGRAFDTVGKLMEFIVHKAIVRLPGYGCRIPTTIGDVTTGNHMRESVNLDLSTYVSPLYTRVMRSAFSIHSKHHDSKKDIGARHIPTQICIPRYTPCNGNMLSLDEMHNNRRHFMNSAYYAKAITMNIPTFSDGVDKLIEDYVRSDLFKFHSDMDNTRVDEYYSWHDNYDKFDLKQLPICVAKALKSPNPRLLEPSHIQTLVRVLTGKKWWHPKHVAGLIRSKYERDFDWEYNWDKYDAFMHANNWVRFYAGLLATGIDQRTDQNCISHQEKGLCLRPSCGFNLGDYR